MKMQGYGITINGQFVIAQIHLHEESALRVAHQINYERFFKDNVKLVKVSIEYETIQQISQNSEQQQQAIITSDKELAQLYKRKKRKKKRRKLKV